jgi:hypothetical protein
VYCMSRHCHCWAGKNGKIYVPPPDAAFARIPISLVSIMAAMDVAVAVDAAAAALGALVLVLVVRFRQPKSSTAAS